MVKIDFNRDYYGDLGLTPDASDAEIKKQFRKLALQYHPDRNHGKEEDANEKFQIIGAAHEILSDPAQRTKYNAGRVQYTSRFPRASGVKGNPWANVGSQFQPPPQRGHTRPKSTGSTPATGTAGFSQFTSATPPTTKHNSNATKNAYTAWQKMRPDEGRERPSAKPKAPPPPPRASATTHPNKRPVPQTPTQKVRTEAAFGNGRKTGFHPRSNDDEPPVKSSNYSTTGRRTTTNMYTDIDGDDEEEDIKPTPPPRHKTPSRNSIPRENAFDNTTSEESSSENEPSSRPPFPKLRRPTTAPSANATSSAHTSRKSSQDGSFGTAASTAGYDSPSGATTPMYEHPSVDFNEPQTPKSTQKTESAASSAGRSVRAAKSAPATPLDQMCTRCTTESTFMKKTGSARTSLTPDWSSSFADLPVDVFQQAVLKGLAKKRCKKTLAAQGESENKVAQTESAKDAGSVSPGPDISMESFTGDAMEDVQGEAMEDIQQTPQSTYTGAESETANTDCERFNFADISSQLPTDGIPGGSSRRSTDNIETQFSPRTTEGFAFSAGGDVKSPASKTSSTYGESGSTAGFFNRDSVHSVPKSKFDPSDWNNIGPESFVPQHGSPTRTPTSRGMSRKPRRRRSSTSLGGDSLDSADSNDAAFHRGPSKTNINISTESPNAMDIDSPPRERTSLDGQGPPIPPKVPQAANARNVPVEPAKKEWRPGSFGGSPPLKEIRRKSLNTKACGSEDSPEFFDTLNDMRNTEPFMNRPGLGSFNDLKQDLPFESKASSRRAKSSSELPKAQILEFPQAPRAPIPPGNGYSTPGSSTNDLFTYAVNFQKYLCEWEEFNGRISSHFQTRTEQVHRVRSKLGQANVLSDHQLKEQLEWARQDREVRQRWTMACDDHDEQVRQYLELKKRISRD